MQPHNLNKIKRRIIELSYKHKLSHIGSCLNALPALVEIFEQKQPYECFVLSAGHAGLAYYCVLEHFSPEGSVRNHLAEDLLNEMGVHPVRKQGYIDCSTGSLGMGITVATGMAAASPNKNVYCLCSDGEAAEGSVYEALRYAYESELDNLKIHFYFNGYSATQKIKNVMRLAEMIHAMNPQVKIHHEKQAILIEGGLAAHYQVLNEEQYIRAINFFQ